MATLPFQRLVREVCLDLCPVDLQLRWQSNALFTFQTATEAYLASFYNDINLCAVQERGRDHVGGRGQVLDVSAVNVSKYQVTDRSELKWQRNSVHATLAEGRDWNYDL